MAQKGFRMVVQGMQPPQIGQIAASVAQQQGYAVSARPDGTTAIGKGNLIAGIFLGAFIKYCNFTLSIVPRPDGTQEMFIFRNTPWWTGAIGVSRVKKAAAELGLAVMGAVQQQGGKVLGQTAD